MRDDKSAAPKRRISYGIAVHSDASVPGDQTKNSGRRAAVTNLFRALAESHVMSGT
jgi:hypothetical protein